jgi:bacterioferritin (cytochrome b1)
MAKGTKDNKALVAELNKALGWELRAQAMYAHYAAYIGGLDSLALKSHFEEEAQESFGHAGKVRDLIAQIGAVAVTTRDEAPVVHTTSTRKMLQEALKTEQAAAAQYKAILPLVNNNVVFTHTILHIMMDEMKAVVEVETLLGK